MSPAEVLPSDRGCDILTATVVVSDKGTHTHTHNSVHTGRQAAGQSEQRRAKRASPPRTFDFCGLSDSPRHALWPDFGQLASSKQLGSDYRGNKGLTQVSSALVERLNLGLLGAQGLAQACALAQALAQRLAACGRVHALVLLPFQQAGQAIHRICVTRLCCHLHAFGFQVKVQALTHMRTGVHERLLAS